MRWENGVFISWLNWDLYHNPLGKIKSKSNWEIRELKTKFF